MDRTVCRQQVQNDSPHGMKTWTEEGSHWPAGCHNTIMKGILEKHTICRGRDVHTDLACRRVRSTYVRGMSLSVTRSNRELQTHRIQTWVALLNCFTILDWIFQSEIEENLGWEHDLLMLRTWSLASLLWRSLYLADNKSYQNSTWPT